MKMAGFCMSEEKSKKGDRKMEWFAVIFVGVMLGLGALVAYQHR